MAKLTLSNITSGYLPITTVNANWDAIETALENTLSRDGTSPNTMSADLDMNSRSILNLASLDVDSLSINGTLVVPTGTVASVLPTQTSHADKFLQTNGTSLSWQVPDAPEIAFTATRTGAVAQTALRRFDNSIHVMDFVPVGTVTATAASDVYVQAAATAAAGKTLILDSGTYNITATLNWPSNIVVEGAGPGAVLQCNVASANFMTTTSKSNITFRNIKFTTLGNYSAVMTFTLCNNVTFENCIFDLPLTGPLISSVAFRSYGSTKIKFSKCQFFDADSFIYLDKSGATNSDDVLVSECYFEHRVIGSGANPTGIYKYNCTDLTVDKCTFINIAPTNGTTYGYSVYDADGTRVGCLTVTNCVSRMTVARPHIMVLNNNTPVCIVKENKFYAYAPSYPTYTWFNFLYHGGPELGSVNVSDNFSDKAAIWVRGAGSAATATRSVIVHHNQIQFVSHSLGGSIRIGNIGAEYVDYAEVTRNTIYNSYSCSINISHANFANVDDNVCQNWNTGNSGSDTIPYSMAIYWEGVGANSSNGYCRRNRLLNNTVVAADTGYTVDGIVVQNATNGVVLEYNNIEATVSVPYIRCVSYNSEGTWTPAVGGTATYTGATGIWRKRGKQVTLYWDLTINVIGTGNANIISGIPAALTTSYACGVSIGVFTGGAASVVHLGGYISGVTIQLVGATAAATAFTSVGPMGNATHISGTATYLLV